MSHVTPLRLDPSSLLAGALAAMVALWLGEAVRRRARARARARAKREHIHVIDGARPEPRAALDVMPAPEARSSSEPLESERQDVDPMSERW